jgi:hypothetical protein
MGFNLDLVPHFIVRKILSEHGGGKFTGSSAVLWFKVSDSIFPTTEPDRTVQSGCEEGGRSHTRHIARPLFRNLTRFDHRNGI